MEPPRKKARLISVHHWNPIEWAFLLGTQSPKSSIRRAFGVQDYTRETFHSLSERRIIRLIFDFQKWPQELRTFQPPKGYEEDNDGAKLPQVQDDGRVLIMYQYECDDDCSSEDEGNEPFWTTKVFFDPTSETYEVSTVEYRYAIATKKYKGNGEIERFETLSQVLTKLRDLKTISEIITKLRKNQEV